MPRPSYRSWQSYDKYQAGRVETICVSGASPNSLEDGAAAMHIVVGMHKNRSLEHGQGFAVNRKLFGGDGLHLLKSGVGSFSTEIASYELQWRVDVCLKSFTFVSS